MKKIALLLVLILLAQICFSLDIVLAQSEEADIKTLIDNYYKGLANHDINLVMQQVSPNVSANFKEGKMLDYNGFKSSREAFMKNALDISISNLNIRKLSVEGSKATAEIELNMKYFNLSSAEEVNRKSEIVFYLGKEGGYWKIIRNIVKDLQEPLP